MRTYNIKKAVVSPGVTNIGDLSFFYDMNALGNRHIGTNLRLLIINNGHGQVFANYTNSTAYMDEQLDEYVAAGGHFGNKSPSLIKHYSCDLGFEYISASTIEEFKDNICTFVDLNKRNKSVVFEVFTDSETENDALKIARSLERTAIKSLERAAKDAVKKIIR